MADREPSFLDTIPQPLRVALAVLLVGVVFYLLYIQIFSPKLSELQNLDDQIATLDKQVAQMEAQVRSHSAVTDQERAEWDRVQAQLDERIPPDHELPALIEQITILTDNAGLLDAVISTSKKVALERESGAVPVAPPPAPQLVTSAAQARSLRSNQTAQPSGGIQIADVISAGYFPITITFHGTFRNQGQFLEDLANLPHLVEFESLEISREFPETGFRVILRSYHSGGVKRV